MPSQRSRGTLGAFPVAVIAGALMWQSAGLAVPAKAQPAPPDHLSHAALAVQGEPVAAAEPTESAPSAAPAEAAAFGAAAAEIRFFYFSPDPITVPAGTIVTWTNADAIVHSVTAGTPDIIADVIGAFDSGLFDEGQSFSFAFAEPGAYPYFCSRHPSMRGFVTVSPA